MWSNNNEKDNSLKTSNKGEEGIRPADIDNNEEDINLPNINEERLAIPNWMSQNRLSSELSSTFREVTFSESKFPTTTPVLDTRYKYS